MNFKQLDRYIFSKQGVTLEYCDTWAKWCRWWNCSRTHLQRADL